MNRIAVCTAALLACCSVAPSAFAQVVGEKKVKTIKIEWASYETKNYTFQYESVIPKSTVKRIGEELEDILVQYVKLFRVKPTEKLKVKFLDSLNTYEQEGGDPSHPGYYNPGSRILVLKQMKFYNLIPTSYHEAFHQYLHMYVGDGVAIPTWYNEGMAMYYEGMQRNPGEGKRPLNPKRIKNRKLRMVKSAVFTRSHVPLESLVDATYEQFHDKEKESLYYNQSFAVIYFFMEKTRGRAPLLYAKALRDKKDIEEANAKLFGKKRKSLKKIEAQWKSYLAKVHIDKD